MTGVREGSAAGRAQTLNDLGRAAEALTVVSSGLAQEPQDVDLLVQGAVALVQLDRDDEAVRYCLAAAAADPDSVVVQKVLSVALRGAGDRVGAYHAAVRATQLAPHDPGAHIQVAHSASDLRDPHNGRMAAEYALRLAPSSPSAHLAMVAALFPPGSPPSKATMREAEQHARTALSLRPDDHVALNELARIQMARGRLVSAAGHLSTSVRAAPFETVMQRNMDLVLTGLIARFHWILFLVWFVGTQVVGAANGQPPRWLLVLLGAIGAVALGWIAWQLRAQVPADMRLGFLRGFARRQRLAAVWGVCLLLTCLLFLAAAVSPTSLALTLFVVGGGPLFLGAVLSWVRFFRDRRAS